MQDTTQQASTNQATTGNPQDILAQSDALQNASAQSSQQIRALDNSATALQVSSITSAIPLNGITATSIATVQQPASTTVSKKDIFVFAGIALVVVIFMAILAYGMFKPHHSK
jgi:hypothetical protein